MLSTDYFNSWELSSKKVYNIVDKIQSQYIQSCDDIITDDNIHIYTRVELLRFCSNSDHILLMQ